LIVLNFEQQLDRLSTYTLIYAMIPLEVRRTKQC